MREKERVTVLLDINRELLLEVMSLQALQNEARSQDNTAPAEGDAAAEEKAKAKKEKVEKLKSEYMEYATPVLSDEECAINNF
jgi:hypothetical protein